MASETIILVDDEPDILEAYEQTLRLEGYTAQTYLSARAALDVIDIDWPGVVVTDLRMPRMDGLELLRRIGQIDPEIPVILVTAHGDVAVAVEAMRGGAHDFLEKPPNPVHMLKVIARAAKHRRLILDNRRLRAQLQSPVAALDKIVGSSAPMVKLRKTIATLANADIDTLIMGETGTGKELIARALHKCGPRARQKFVALNCAALPENLIESELFGHEKGAFTNAGERRIGRMEYADKGVLFLDEIESMPPSIQAKLLRVLQERSFERLGSNQTIKVDIRVIAASKDDLKLACARGEFRADLYYRLNVASIEVVPLRQRRDDIPELFNAFVHAAAMSRGCECPEVLPSLLASLLQYDWPGNVRELENDAQRHVIGLPIELPIEEGNTSTVSASSHSSHSSREEYGEGLNVAMETFEKQAITRALTYCNGQIALTAQHLAIARRTLHLRMQKYGLHKEDYRPNKK